MKQKLSANKSSLIQEIELFLNELSGIETKKAVLVGRVAGETIRETAMRLNVTDQRIMQIEAKIARRFVMSQRGNNIISAISSLKATNAEFTVDELKTYLGEYYDTVIYLLRLYKDSYFYDGSMEFIDK